jgi:hypothetical protein
MGFPPTGEYRDADHIIERARLERSCLGLYWHEAAVLPHFDQREVAIALEAIKPAKIDGRPCEPDWRFGRSARNRVKDAQLRSSMPGAGNPETDG